MQNPYTHRSTIRDPAMFFGRTGDLTRIYAMLANTQSVSIVGDRRIGKSSLLYGLALPQIQARIDGYDFSNYCFIYIDLQGSVYRDAAEFLDYLLSRLKARLETEVPALAADPTAAVQDRFEIVIDSANRHDVKLIFLLDEFDYVTRNESLDAALFSYLRYLATNYELAIVTASQKRLVSLCHTDIVDSPFFNIFARVNLGALAEDEALELITVPSAKVGYPLDADAGWLLDLAGKQPICIQIACFYLLEARMRAPQAETIDYKEVRRLFYEEVRDHFEYAWQHLSDRDQDRLQKEVWQDQGPYGHYLAASSAFRQFLRRQSGWQQEARADLITQDAVETALKNFWKLTELGQSALADLNLVKRQLIQNDLPSLGANVGRSLQNVLHTAIDHLAAGNQEDTQSKQWRHWFILQHCYVEEETNQDIARRLNVAERTFYRERKEAIQAVVTILQDMETTVLAL